MAPPNFPTSLDSLANPTPTTLRNAPGFSLSAQVSALNDIVEALEAKLGIGASTPGASAGVLRRTAAGASAWGQTIASDIANLNVGATHLAGGGAGDANTVLRTTNGTNVVFGKVTAADYAAATFPSLIATSGILVSPQVGFSFSGISQSYKHLELRITARSAAAAANEVVLVAFNGDFAANYQGQELIGQGTSATATEKGPSLGYAHVGYVPAASTAANYFASFSIMICNYTTVGYHYKSVYSISHGAYGTSAGFTQIMIDGATWRNTGAITQVYFGTAAGNNVVPGSIASLYGWN
jgi:hypothetical protein